MSKESSDMATIYATQDGKLIDEDIVETISDKIENIFDNLDDLIENELDDESDESLGNLLDDGFIKVLKKLTKQEHIDVELVKAVYRSRLGEERSETACEDLRRLSAVGWNECEDFEGDPFTRLKFGGFRRLTDHLAAQIPKELVHLNELVEKIDWSASNPATVSLTTLNRLDKTRNTYVADFVLTTVSLGYLKKYHYDLFTPKLPLNKIKAIENLGFGVVNKIFIVFDRSLLNNSIEGLHILWREDLNFSLDHSDYKWSLEVDEISFFLFL
jgi:spermine oxidase